MLAGRRTNASRLRVSANGRGRRQYRTRMASSQYCTGVGMRGSQRMTVGRMMMRVDSNPNDSNAAAMVVGVDVVVPGVVETRNGVERRESKRGNAVTSREELTSSTIFTGFRYATRGRRRPTNFGNDLRQCDGFILVRKNFA